MSKQRDIWEILEISPTDNKRIIKKAYAKKLTKFHPEEYPEEFQEIQWAYEQALKAISRSIEQPMLTEDTVAIIKQQFQLDTSIYELPYIQNTKASSHDVFIKLYEKMHHTGAFQNVDQLPKSKKNSGLYEGNRQAYMYEQFYKSLQHSKRMETMQTLMLNRAFYDEMRVDAFYERIYQLLKRHLQDFDTITLSFLYDVFAVLDKEYPREKPFSEIIMKHINDSYHRRKRQALKRNLFISALIITIGIPFSLYIALRSQKPSNEDVRSDLEKIILQETNRNHNCKVQNDNNNIWNFQCEPDYGKEITGRMYLDEKGQYIINIE